MNDGAEQRKIRSFKDFVVWQKAHRLALSIYRLTAQFPREELYGITSQVRRAAVSTAANIVEGSKRRSRKDFCHFLNQAQGSNEEVKYFLILAKDLRFIDENALRQLDDDADEIGAMLHGLILKLNALQ